MTELRTNSFNPSPCFLWSLIKNFALPLGHSSQFPRILRTLFVSEWQEIRPHVSEILAPLLGSNSTSHSPPSSTPRKWSQVTPLSSIGVASLSIVDSTCESRLRSESGWELLAWLQPTRSVKFSTLLSTPSHVGLLSGWPFVTLLLSLCLTHLHPLSCSLPDVWELWLPQDKQKYSAFPQFLIEEGHGEWWSTTISFTICAEEKKGLPSKWNKDDLQLGHLIFFFLCQKCKRCCILFYSSRFIFVFETVLTLWLERCNCWYNI